MIFKRSIEADFKEKLKDNKVLVLYGARQVGKTTFLREIFKHRTGVKWLNGDTFEAQRGFEGFGVEKARNLIGEAKILVVDEAQRIEEIGLKLKIIHDSFPGVKVVATGSSAFDLANKVNEPLTGRKWEFWLFPLSFREMAEQTSVVEEKSKLEQRLLYGAYPEVVVRSEVAEQLVMQLVRDNLYKDVLNLGEIIKTDRLKVVLQALAYQVGQVVSLNELGQMVGVDRKTVEKYIALLEKAFVIFRLGSYGGNLRNELKKSQKFYFYDTGVRNALIEDFRGVGMRQDVGALFENYMVAELRKLGGGGEPYLPSGVGLHKGYFWRTKQGQEVDYVAVKNTYVSAVEMKWSERKKARIPEKFLAGYGVRESLVVNRENYDEVLMGGAEFLRG